MSLSSPKPKPPADERATWSMQQWLDHLGSLSAQLASVVPANVEEPVAEEHKENIVDLESKLDTPESREEYSRAIRAALNEKPVPAGDGEVDIESITAADMMDPAKKSAVVSAILAALKG